MFLLSYDGEIRETPVWPQGGPVSFRVARGGRGIDLESRQGNWVSRCVEGGISRSFWICGRKPWVPLNCDGDLRELLMVPVGSQENCGVGRGLSGLHWVWCNGRQPLLELRWEPQGSSTVLTWVLSVYAVLKRESGVYLCRGMELCFPPELSKGFQAFRRVEFGT